MRTLDPSTAAGDPGALPLSRRKLGRFHPELLSWWRWRLGALTGKHPFGAGDRGYMLAHVEEHLLYGDSRAAVVVGLRPLRVAAYTDELDCTALLAFPDALADEYRLKVGGRLLTVNTYASIEQGVASDLAPGEGDRGRWGNFAPYIAEFLTDQIDRVEARKAEISPDEWSRTEFLGRRMASEPGVKPRDGRPLYCAFPATR